MNNPSRIIRGGGWKDSRSQTIRIKAWGTLFLTIVFGGAAVAGPDWLLLYAGILAGISLSLSVLFFLREKPTEFPSDRSSSDPGKLYGSSDQSKKQS